MSLSPISKRTVLKGMNLELKPPKHKYDQMYNRTKMVSMKTFKKRKNSLIRILMDRHKTSVEKLKRAQEQW